MREEEVTSFSADGTRLAGTLSLPVGTSRAGRVMIRGTGPLDRDENASAKPGQRLDIFKALVASLAASRYASLHYDKRGCGQSSGDYLVHEQADLIADVRASIEDLAAQNIGPVVLLGHSEWYDHCPSCGARTRRCCRDRSCRPLHPADVDAVVQPGCRSCPRNPRGGGPWPCAQAGADRALGRFCTGAGLPSCAVAVQRHSGDPCAGSAAARALAA